MVRYYTSKELFSLLLSRFKEIGYDKTREFYGCSVSESIRRILNMSIFTDEEVNNLFYTMACNSKNFNDTVENTFASYNEYLTETIFSKWSTK